MGMPRKTLSCKLTIMSFERTTVPHFPEEVKKKIMTKQTDNGNENHYRYSEPTSFAPERTFPHRIPGTIDIPSPLRSGFISFPPRKKLTSFFLFAYN